MIRCPWCGAENYAIDMWCARCQHHLDWQPVAHKRRRPGRTLALVAPVAAAIGVAIVLALPAASWFNGSLLGGTSLPKTGAVPPVPSYQAQVPTPAATAPEATPSDAAAPAASVTPPAPSQPQPAVGTLPQLQIGRAGDPIAAINQFYAEISAHQFAGAASLWSPRMQAQYPPGVYIDQRFSATQQIGLTGGQVISQGSGVAIVDVNVAELIGGQHRAWTGTWQLVDTGSGWLLNSPNLRAG